MVATFQMPHRLLDYRIDPMQPHPTVCTEPFFKRSDEEDVPLIIGLDGADPLFPGLLPDGVTILVATFAVPSIGTLSYTAIAPVADPRTGRASTGVTFTVSFGTDQTAYRVEVNCDCSDGSTRQAAIDVLVRD